MTDDSDDRKGPGNVRDLDEYRERIKAVGRSVRKGLALARKKPAVEEPTPEEEAKRFRPTPLRDALRRYLYIKESSPIVAGAMDAIPPWITPNGVTLFRGLLIVPVVLLFQASLYWWALLTLGIAFFLDFVDGALAHRRKQFTVFGTFMDPVMDKVLVCGSLLALMPLLDRDFRMLIVGIVGIAIGITGIRVLKLLFPRFERRLPGIKAGFVGKLKFNVEVVAVLCTVLGLALRQDWLLTAAFVTLALSVALALVSFVTQFLRPKKPS